jgi:hypothetical protein
MATQRRGNAATALNHGGSLSKMRADPVHGAAGPFPSVEDILIRIKEEIRGLKQNKVM